MALEVLVRAEDIPVEEHQITYEKADAYGRATQDANKIHQRVEYGFKTTGILLNYADGIMANTAPQMQCTSQESGFEHFIPFGSEVECYARSDVTRDGDKCHVEVAVRIKGQPDPAAVSKMTYGTRSVGVPRLKSPDEDKEVNVKTYDLTNGKVEGVAVGLDQIGGALANLAIALSSNTIWSYDDGREKRGEEGLIERLRVAHFLPVYKNHALNLYAPLGGLRVGDKIAIATDARKIARKIEQRWAAGVERFKDKPFTIEADVTRSGLLVAHEELRLVFSDEEGINRLIEGQLLALRGA